jgi:23S rRNA (adenine2503-C2)-methyltransferase
MREMKIINTIKSEIDNTRKQIFLSQNNVLEFSYIDKNDGKDIVVVPTQTSCNLGCKFCFLTGLNIPVRNLRSWEMVDGIKYSLMSFRDENEVLLVSFMGCGEPLCNTKQVVKTMNEISNLGYDYNLIRFAVASLIPSKNSLQEFTELVVSNRLLVKFHYSLHTPNDVLRKQLMPAAIPSKEAIFELKRYNRLTGNNVEIHYSLMNNLNDSDKDAEDLSTLLHDTGFNVKVLKLSEKTSELQCSDKVDKFRSILTKNGIDNEYYEPPGNDVGASCGQFLLSYYENKSRPSIRKTFIRVNQKHQSIFAALADK